MAKTNKLKILNKKVIRPNQAEIENNPSARSARLRIAQRCGES
jgi:16S rRNA C1402 N4-methylase RsmH